MENIKVLEAFIATLRVKLSDSTFRIAELETLLVLEQEKTEGLQLKLEEGESSEPSHAVKSE